MEEYALNESEFLKLLKHLCGLCESGDLWNDTIEKYHSKDLGWLFSGLKLHCKGSCMTNTYNEVSDPGVLVEDMWMIVSVPDTNGSRRKQ